MSWKKWEMISFPIYFRASLFTRLRVYYTHREIRIPIILSIFYLHERKHRDNQLNFSIKKRRGRKKYKTHNEVEYSRFVHIVGRPVIPKRYPRQKSPVSRGLNVIHVLDESGRSREFTVSRARGAERARGEASKKRRSKIIGRKAIGREPPTVDVRFLRVRAYRRRVWR